MLNSIHLTIYSSNHNWITEQIKSVFLQSFFFDPGGGLKENLKILQWFMGMEDIT